MLDTAHALARRGLARLSRPDPLVSSLPSDLANFLGCPEPVVRREMRSAGRVLAALWDRRPVGESEEAWYRREDVGQAQMLLQADWHLTGEGAIAARLVRGLGQPGRALDFGSGIGLWSLMAAREGCEVISYEPNDYLACLDAFRVSKWQPDAYLKVYGFWSPIVQACGRGFQTVIAWHVLEHLTDPWTAARDIAAVLRPGGLLLTDSAFCRSGGRPWHHTLPRGKRVGDIWRQAGLRQVGLWRWIKSSEGLE